MDEREELKDDNQVIEEVKEPEVVKEIEQTSDDKGYLKYYLFILFNSILGFIFLLYFSKQLFNVLAERNIINLKNLNIVPNVILASTLSMVFMLITIIFKKFFRKFLFSEIILYIYIGVLTTMINIISWNFFFNLIKKFIVSESVAWKVAEVIAFIVAVIFAFFADKIIVFKSYSFAPWKVFSEMGAFFSARIITELINIGIMYFLIDRQNKEPLFGKIIASIVIIVLNYLFSKFVIFKKKKITNEE